MCWNNLRWNRNSNSPKSYENPPENLGNSSRLKNLRQDTLSMSFPGNNTMVFMGFQPRDEIKTMVSFTQKFVEGNGYFPKSGEVTSSHLHLHIFSFSNLTLPSILTNFWLLSHQNNQMTIPPAWVKIPFWVTSPSQILTRFIACQSVGWCILLFQQSAGWNYQTNLVNGTWTWC